MAAEERHLAERARPGDDKGEMMATILYVGTSGSDDPTRAGLPFNFALGAAEAGHQAQIFLAGEAAYLMKEDVAAAIVPVAMPALREMMEKTVASNIPIYV
jgi:predicted peroxiredoxin